MVSATTLVVLNFIVAFATYRFKAVEVLVEGRPQVLIHNGRLYEQALTDARLTRHELDAALRRASCADIEDVRYAVLENNGEITVLPRESGQRT
jgi:uncharacterized membrane protein YcaP (DUF421 family)